MTIQSRPEVRGETAQAIVMTYKTVDARANTRTEMHAAGLSSLGLKAANARLHGIRWAIVKDC